MKPEKKAPSVELNDEEKAVYEILKKVELSELKSQSGLCDKK